MGYRMLASGMLLVALGAGAMTQGRGDDKPREQFAQDRPLPVAFNADRSMRYLREICKIGPRISGSEGMKKQQTLLEKHFTEHGARVEWQKFTARQRSQKNTVEMANMVARWHPERNKRVIICAHYDTRPLADQEPDPRKWKEPFLGANDGGSGVALMMELAHHMKDLKTQVGVDFVLFDGEEWVFKPDDLYFLGSKHFANEYTKRRNKQVYAAAILVDMIAGKGAKFPVEANSWFAAATLVIEFWTIAEELKCDAFQKTEGPNVEDDHIALNRAGIPAIDVIDFSYRHWHRLSDAPENCDGEGLSQVGKVLSVWLQKQR